MANYKKMKCINAMTGELKGYLATLRNYVTVVPEKENGAWVQWSSEGNDLYLDKDTSPTDRYLGVAENSYAGWGLKGGGYRDPILYNSDQTISLKAKPKRKLYGPYETLGNDYVCWTGEDEDNQNVLRFVMED